ncbi:mucin-13-like [Candoia aspera]|uniref:mucin-13-like n=1 Tax=Candoia aspera TaxID=51853 RepID=UPI002FD8439D
MKSFVFFGILWLTLGYVRQASQSMIDYLAKNIDPPVEKCPNQTSIYGATCIKLYDTTIYRCPYGFYYNSACQLGRVFTGQVPLNVPYHDSMENKESQNYIELYDNLTHFFNKTFEGNDLQEITIFSVK